MQSHHATSAASAAAVILAFSLILLPTIHANNNRILGRNLEFFTSNHLQISSILPSAEAEAPAPAASQSNLTALISAHGCKVFAETLLASPAAQTYESNVESGLTVFCPGDDAMKGFLPKYNNLTADGKQSLLEFHGIPIYESMQDLRSNNGLTNTLATDGDKNYNFTIQNDGNVVTIKTKIATAKVIKTLTDEQPLAIYELNEVLMPFELFKGALPPAPAPSPKASKAPTNKGFPQAPDAPADAPAVNVADQTADGNGAVRRWGGRFSGVILGVWFVLLQM